MMRGPGTALVEKHYRAGANNRVVEPNRAGIFANAESARPSDHYCTLDTTDEGEGISTVAFARLGGFFLAESAGKIKFRRGAWVASGIQNFAAFVFIHEMRHFVEGSSDIGHHGEGWVTDDGMKRLRP
jgi:hypothetical protein